jgi:hypothetical protein
MKNRLLDVLLCILASIILLFLLTLTLASKGFPYNNPSPDSLYASGACTVDALGQAWIGNTCMNREGIFRLLPTKKQSDRDGYLFTVGHDYTIYKTSFFWIDTYFVGDAELLEERVR